MVSTPLKNISQIGNLPQVGVKVKNIWIHHLLVAFEGNTKKSHFAFLCGTSSLFWPSPRKLGLKIAGLEFFPHWHHTHRKINDWNPENHPIGKEHHLNQTSIFGSQPLIVRGVGVANASTWTMCKQWSINCIWTGARFSEEENRIIHGIGIISMHLLWK